jgi:hypothetical protein
MNGYLSFGRSALRRCGVVICRCMYIYVQNRSGGKLSGNRRRMISFVRQVQLPGTRSSRGITCELLTTVATEQQLWHIY